MKIFIVFDDRDSRKVMAVFDSELVAIQFLTVKGFGTEIIESYEVASRYEDFDPNYKIASTWTY